MENYYHRSMGYTDSDRRILDRIHKPSPSVPRNKIYRSSIQIVRKICPVRGGRQFITKISYRVGSRLRKKQRFLQPFLPGPKKGWWRQANPKSKTVKQVCEDPTLQNANFASNHSSSYARRLGGKARSKGCLLSYSNTSTPQKISQIRNSGKLLSVPCTTFRPDLSPEGFHQDNGCGRGPPSQTTDSNLSILGRLDDKVRERQFSKKICRRHSQRNSKIRPYSKLEQVGSGSNSKAGILGDGFQSERRESISNPREVRTHVPNNSVTEVEKRNSGKMPIKNTGTNGSLHRYGSMGSIVHATNSVVPTVKMAASQSFNRKSCASQSSLVPTPVMVDRQGQFFQGKESVYPKCSNHPDNGCFQNGLGCPYRKFTSKWSMGCEDSIKQTHKLVGAECSIPQLATFQANCPKSDCDVTNGQFHCGIICKQTGGNKIPGTVCIDMAAPQLVQNTKHHSFGSPHTRKKECNCGSSVKRVSDKAHRVGISSGGSGSDFLCLGETAHRSFCNAPKQQTSDLLLSGTRRKCGSNRCIFSMLGGSSCVCVPSSNNDSQGAAEGSQRGLCSNPHSTPLAKAELVPASAEAVNSTTTKTATKD